MTQPPRSPAAWTLDDATGVFPAPPKPKVGVGDPLLYLSGDHWQAGRPYMGPGRDSLGQLSADNAAKTERHFVPVPEAQGCVRERVNGACGTEPDVSLQPTAPAGTDADGNPAPSDEQSREADDWKRDISAWWDEKEFWGSLDDHNRSGVRNMLAFASASDTGACLRLFFNPASRTEAPSGDVRIPRQRDRRAGLAHVLVTAPEPGRCTVYVDPDTMQQTGVFLFTEDGQQSAEVWFGRPKGGRMETVMRRFVPGRDVEEHIFPFGGQIPLFHAGVGNLLTEPVLRLQATIDFTATSLKRLTESHGFTSRTHINAADNGAWKLTPPVGADIPETTTLADGRTAYFHPEPPELGNGVVTLLNGRRDLVRSADDGDQYQITTPSVHYHEPSDPKAVISALDAFTMMLRDACHQGHRVSGLSGGSTAEASGDAYEQKRAAFEADIRNVAEVADGVVAHALAMATVMADWLAGVEVPDFIERWTVKVQSHPHAGPVSTEKQGTAQALYDGGIISLDEAMARVGVQDVQAEKERLAANRSPEQKAGTAKSLIDSTADPVAAWIAAGFDEETAKAFARTDGPPFVEQ